MTPARDRAMGRYRRRKRDVAGQPAGGAGSCTAYRRNPDAAGPRQGGSGTRCGRCQHPVTDLFRSSGTRNVGARLEHGVTRLADRIVEHDQRNPRARSPCAIMRARFLRAKALPTRTRATYPSQVSKQARIARRCGRFAARRRRRALEATFASAASAIPDRVLVSIAESLGNLKSRP